MFNTYKSQHLDFNRLRIILTVIVLALIGSLLIWAHFQGGVPSHHILNRKELPEISNWWGGILLPLLTWILSGRTINRIQKQNTIPEHYKSEIIIISRLFTIGLSFGIILSVSFINDFKPFLDNVLYILLFLSLIVPIYYSEFILGFIFGMTYTFGVLLPTVFVLIMASVGFLLFRFIRPFLLKIFKVVK